MVFEYKGTDYEFPDDMDDNEALKLIKKDIGETEPISSSISQPEQTQNEKYGLAGSLFPATTSATERGGNLLSRTIAGAGDALTLPARGVAALSTGLGTLAGGGSLKDATREAGNELSHTKSKEKGALGFAQNMALDPTSSPLLLGVGTGLKGVKTGYTLGKATLKTGIEGAGFGAGSSVYQQAEEGKIDAGKTAAQSALGFGLGAAATGLPKLALEGVKKGSESLGLKIANVLTKPKERDFNAGFKTENLYDYDLLKNDMGKTVEKTQSTIEDYANQLRAKIAEGNEAGAIVDVNKIIDNSIKSVVNEKTVLGKKAKIGALEGLREEVLTAYPSGVMDLADAQMFKREVGAKGAWFESHGGRTIDKDATEKAQAISNFYGHLKTDIEHNAPEGVKEINQHLSNLIPIENTLLKRLYVSQRNEVIPLKDMIAASAAMTGHPAVWLLAGANRLANSASVGKGLYNLGKTNTKEVAIPTEKSTLAELPKDWNIPTFERKGVKPETITPITDKKRLIGGWSINEGQKVEPPIPTKGERMKSLGESGAREFDKPSAGSAGRLNLPSPEEIKKLYPHLSEEDIKKVIYQLDDKKALPAPMIDNGSPLQKFERQYPTLGQKLGAIGDLKGKKLKDIPFTLLKNRKGK